MNKLATRSLFLVILAARAAFAVVETNLPPEGFPTDHSAVAGPLLNVPPALISVVVPPLTGAPLPTASRAPMAPAALAPDSSEIAPPAPPIDAPKAAPGALAAEVLAPEPKAASSSDGDDNFAVTQGRTFFDVAAPTGKKGVRVWTKITNWARIGDRIPTWPGTTGEKVRLNGRTFVLEQRLAFSESSSVWRAKSGVYDGYVVKMLRPESAISPHQGDEAGLLRAIKNSDIPHAQLVTASADGRVMVKDLVKGTEAVEVFATGFAPSQAQNWTELAAGLIQAGVTADLSPGNLIWENWGYRWVIHDAGGVENGSPEKVVAQLLSPAAQRAGVDAGAFLAGLRGRLGPDSAAWTKTLAALISSSKYGPELAALAARDRALPPPPQVAFAPAADPAPFPDRVGRPSDIKQALDYEPLKMYRHPLHSDDPGKTNTIVFRVDPDGKMPVVVKIAKWDIIRRELAVRRVVRRWFGRHFDVPTAFGVNDGDGSYLVMESKRGSGTIRSNPLTPEQRAALAVLAHAFGLSDVNPGNVLFSPHSRPVLIDFEYSFFQRTRAHARLPDESIAFEMPWVSRFEFNRAEDYQPASRAWRALMDEPASSAALLADFQAAGFSAKEAAAMLAVVKQNTARLDWMIQNDVDFANQFVAEKRAAAARH